MDQPIELSEKNLNRAGSFCSPDPRAQLRIALQDGDLNTFKKTLKSGVDQSDLNYMLGDPHYGTLLDLACRTQNRKQFVDALLQAGADPNKINSVHKKAPLHFAVENNDYECIKLLIRSANIDPNILDSFGNTPLHYAAKQDNVEILMLLLSNKSTKADIENRKGQRVIDICEMKNNNEAIRLIQQSINNEDTKPEHSNKENVLTSANLFSMIHKHEFNAFLEAIKNHKHLVDENDGLYTFLQYLSENGGCNEVEMLLQLGADPNKTHPSNKTKPIILACRKGYYNIVQVFVDNDKTTYESTDGETVLHAVINGSVESLHPTLGAIEENQDHNKTLELLLTQVAKNKLNINSTDLKGNTALHYAASQGNREFIVQLLRHGAYIGIRNKFGEPAIADVHPRIFETYLDECLTTNDKLPREDNYTIIFNYNFLVPPRDVQKPKINSSQVTVQLDSNMTKLDLQGDVVISETDPLLYICQSPDLRPLLKHPILTSFLHLKWNRIRRFFFFNLIVYIIFWVLLTGYILGIYGADISNDKISSNATRTEREINDFEALQNNNSWSEPLRILVTLFLIVLFIRELFQLIISPLRYLLSPENWLEIGIISVTVAILFCNSCTQVRHQISAIAILLSWAELILLIGRHPSLSTNIEMLKTVSWNFLKFLAWYSILIVAFALSFYTLFRDSKDEEDNFFLTPTTSVFKTVVMLTGEFDAGSIPFVAHPGVSHILFVLFVFLIAIVLFNLLNGLAVSDTQTIKADAELVGYISRVKLISYFETMALGDPIPYKSFFDKLRLVCCYIPEVNCYSTQFKCLRYFSRKISLFSDLANECEIYVLPNQENKVVSTSTGYCRKRQELDEIDDVQCLEPCTAYYMCANTMRTAKKILAEKTDEENKLHTIGEKDKLLLDFAKRLDVYKESLDTLKKSAEKTQTMMDQILTLLKKEKPLLHLSDSDTDNQ